MDNTMSVGVHKDVPFTEYRTWDAVSQSKLKKMRFGKTPRHLKFGVDRPDTQAQVVGDAVHCAILTPSLFTERFVRQIEGDGRTKAVKQAREIQALENPLASCLSPYDYDTVRSVANSVTNHPYCSYLLDGGSYEQSILFNYRDTMCKARIDIVTSSGTIIADIKTTRDASEEAFARDLYKYGYHIQAAFYLIAANAVGINAQTFGIIAVEKEPPFELMVYELEGEIIDEGIRELRFLMAKYHEAELTGDWQGYPQTPVRINLLSWAKKKIEELPNLL